jgi:hypothetical protein
MLIILLLGIADFARVFAAGVTLEAATRNGAEAAALERLRSGPAVTPGDPAYYERLRLIAARAACAESRSLPNANYVPDNPSTVLVNEESCPSDFTDGASDNDGPVVAVCIEDDTDGVTNGNEDPSCPWYAPWVTGTVPSGCGFSSTTWSTNSLGELGSHAIRVKTCYHFTTLLNLHVALPLGWGISLGDLWLHEDRVFVVDCPPGAVSAC